jgi:hypothetical protein
MQPNQFSSDDELIDYYSELSNIKGKRKEFFLKVLKTNITFAYGTLDDKIRFISEFALTFELNNKHLRMLNYGHDLFGVPIDNLKFFKDFSNDIEERLNSFDKDEKKYTYVELLQQIKSKFEEKYYGLVEQLIKFGKIEDKVLTWKLEFDDPNIYYEKLEQLVEKFGHNGNIIIPRRPIKKVSFSPINIQWNYREHNFDRRKLVEDYYFLINGTKITRSDFLKIDQHAYQELLKFNLIEYLIPNKLNTSLKRKEQLELINFLKENQGNHFLAHQKFGYCYVTIKKYASKYEVSLKDFSILPNSISKMAKEICSSYLKTLDEIAKQLGISTHSVQKIAKKEKLRKIGRWSPKKNINNYDVNTENDFFLVYNFLKNNGVNIQEAVRELKKDKKFIRMVVEDTKLQGINHWNDYTIETILGYYFFDKGSAIKSQSVTRLNRKSISGIWEKYKLRSYFDFPLRKPKNYITPEFDANNNPLSRIWDGNEILLKPFPISGDQIKNAIKAYFLENRLEAEDLSKMLYVGLINLGEKFHLDNLEKLPNDLYVFNLDNDILFTAYRYNLIHKNEFSDIKYQGRGHQLLEDWQIENIFLTRNLDEKTINQIMQSRIKQLFCDFKTGQYNGTKVISFSNKFNVNSFFREHIKQNYF